MKPMKTYPQPLAGGLLAFGVAALLALAAAAPAAAATQIGRAYPPYAGGICGGALITQVGIQYGSPSYAVPAGGGVITGWGTATATAEGTAKLKVLRPLGGGEYLVLGEDGPHPVAAGSSPTFGGLRIPVQAGDTIGLIAKNTNCEAYFPGSFFESAALSPFDSPAGTTVKVLGYGPQDAVSLSATVEPDADHDGYGDETQDACPADAGAHSARCPVPLGPASAAADTTPPRLRLRGRRVQKLRRDAVVELASSDEAASLRATAVLRIAGERRLRLRAAPVAVEPSAASRLLLRIPGALRRRLRAALDGGKTVRGVVRVSATDAAGNSSRASRVVWLSS